MVDSLSVKTVSSERCSSFCCPSIEHARPAGSSCLPRHLPGAFPGPGVTGEASALSVRGPVVAPWARGTHNTRRLAEAVRSLALG